MPREIVCLFEIHISHDYTLSHGRSLHSRRSHFHVFASRFRRYNGARGTVPLPLSRLLDRELTNAIRAKCNDFATDWRRMPSIMELLGETVDEHMEVASSEREKARKAAVIAAFNTFKWLGPFTHLAVRNAFYACRYFTTV